MHFADFAGAHDYLQKAKAELPQRPGLSRGTALYYLGLALEKLGYRPQAVEAYRAAAEAKDATLIDNDGPAVAPLAARRAGAVSAAARLVWERPDGAAGGVPPRRRGARGGPRRGRGDPRRRAARLAPPRPHREAAARPGWWWTSARPTSPA